jgi:hypothetical protein
MHSRPVRAPHSRHAGSARPERRWLS